MKNIVTKIGIILFIFSIVVSCEKENDSKLHAVFSYVPDGFNVNFTNFSTGATTYVWNFGDGSEESTLKNPTHVFKSKGDYTVKLIASDGVNESVFDDQVTILGPNIKIDGNFADWEYVEYAFQNETNKGGSLRAVKFFAYGNNLNFYFEGTNDMAFAVFDMFIDSDNNPATGFQSWQWPAGSGADYLLEGSPTAGGSVYKHTDPSGGWGWETKSSFSDACKFSAIKTVGDGKAIEFSIDKTKLGNVVSRIAFAITELTESWSAIGSLPAKEEPTSKYLVVKL